MLYDKRWDRKLDYSRARQVLFDAADYLHEHGWCQGHLTNDDGEVCVLGAVKLAAQQHEDGVLAIVLLKQYIGVVAIARWNDEICRNQDEAIRTLIGAANERSC